MKAIRFLFCVICPPIAVLLTGRMGSFLISILLTLFFILPGILHAFFVVIDYHNEQRMHGFKPMTLPR